jgi:hypothetical protein
VVLDIILPRPQTRRRMAFVNLGEATENRHSVVFSDSICCRIRFLFLS